MREEELIKALKEMDKKRVEELELNSRKLYDVIMKIADERDKLLEEKQELIDYLKEEINECKLTGNDEDYIKLDVYEEILSKLVIFDQIEKE